PRRTNDDGRRDLGGVGRRLPRGCRLPRRDRGHFGLPGAPHRQRLRDRTRRTSQAHRRIAGSGASQGTEGDWRSRPGRPDRGQGLMTTEPQPRLTDTRLDRRYQALLAALDLIVDAWDGAHNPPTPVGTGRRTPPRSKPPCSPDVLSALDAAWRDLRSWGQLVMEERDLTLGPRAMTGPDLALFLARHADWLAGH